MSSVTLEFEGLDELIRELTNAPEEIRQQGIVIIRETTEGAATEIALRYPTRSGTLARRVRTEYPSSQILLGRVKSAAPHAHLYEFGTPKGPRKTSKGYNRGKMPAASPEVFVPVVERRRQQMFERLLAMLRTMGFEVSVG